VSEPTDRDAEFVAIAMQQGPDVAEFVLDYVRMLRDSDTPRPGRHALVHNIAEAWAEQATPDWASDEVYQDVVDNVKPQVEYYL